MKKLYLIIITILFSISGIFAQSTTGTEFWLSFMQNFDSPENTLLYITSDVGATGTASMPGTGWSQNFTIPANGSVLVTVPEAQGAAIGVSNSVINKGVYISSDNDIAVYAANQRTASSDATLVMSVNCLGDSYYINAYSPFSGNPSQFVVVGVEDGTSIEIVPSAAVTVGVGAGVPFNITLNAGQVYLVTSSGDLTGTSVKATDIGNCNNFAVFAGNKCANVPLSCTYCDHLYEQMIPVKAWGMEYITVPLMTRDGDTFRVLASEDGTTININGGAGISLNEGEFYETMLNPASYIQGDKPISVAQYSEGTSCDGVTSDPFMIMLSQVEQTLDYIVFQAFNTTAINQFYTNIVTETPNTGLVELDGGAVTCWATVPSNAAYSYARLNIAQGTHVLSSSEGILASVYGFGNVESYGYLAGAKIVPLNVTFDIVVDGVPAAFDEFVDTLTCSQTTVDFQADETNITDISWDFGDGSPIFEGNPVIGHSFPNNGDYTVTMYFMRDGSCVDESIEMIVHTNSTLPPVAELHDSVVCNGDPYLVEFNIPDITFEWQDGSTDNSFYFDHTGDYSLTVTDLIGCSASSDCHVDFVELSVSATPVDISCYGVTDGSITANPIGGTEPYVYECNTTPVLNTQTIDNLDVGSYTVTVTEDQGCTFETTADLIEPPSLDISIDEVTDITCYGFDDGTATIIANGGTTPYTIHWSNATLSGFEPTGLAPGTYDFTVTDDNGCTGENTLTVDDVPEFSETGTFVDVDCYGQQTGQVDVTVNGGVPPYYYNWSNGSLTEDLMSVPAGSYTITLTDSHNCTVANTFVISQPDQLITVINEQDIACYGDNSGQIILNVLGGTYPYNYEWSNETNTQNQIDVYSGNYIVTVTDANGCSTYNYAQITQPSFPLHGEIEPTHVRCFGEANGIADLTVTGGTFPYYYEWNNNEISQDLYDLGPGIYMVIITDGHGCETADTIQILQADAPLDGTIWGNNVACNGGSDGNVYINVSGGREPYHYEWNTGSWMQNQVSVEAGHYYVTVTDDSNCHFVMDYEITEPEAFYIQAMDNPTICYGQTAEIGIGIITGSVPPYTIVWSNDDNGMTTLVNPLETTTYSAQVIDAGNCVSEDIDITVNVLDSLRMSVVPETDTVCPGTPVSFNIDIQGGGIPADSVYVNDTILAIPVTLEVMSDTVLNFLVYDACHFDSAYVTIPLAVYPLPPVDITADKYNGCAPLTVQFAENSDHVGQTYIWDFDDGDFENLSFDKFPEHTFYNARTYHVYLQVESPEGCPNDSTVAITVFPVPDADFRANRESVSLSYPMIYFTNYSDGGFWYNWDFGDGGSSTAENPSHSFTDAGVFDVVLSTVSLFGCVDTAMVQIEVNNELSVYAPTAFTPNHDELNEEFKVILANVDLDKYKLTVFSRWGETVFESEDYEEAWNGRYNDMMCNPGVYSWIVVFTDLYGNEYTEAGYFTLIR
ncbi:MAG: hypothetical protein C0596_08965 [Marinilabiliales bacterium]|nr:MAG: hypothetical protein C0596_08965 [Marinilabiliales bacterium]